MKNFQCYYGEHTDNQFEFGPGLNFIIGNNGGGKSKLFDAFFWVLNDEIFNSDRREFQSTAEYGENIISARVTRDCAVGDTATCEVIIELTSASENEYRLTRIFHATKGNENGKWICEGSKLIIENKKNLRWFPIDESKHEYVLKLVMPPHLKPYMWFQGEQVDSLMDLTDKHSLTQIVKLLSDIEIYDEIQEIAEKGLEKSDTELRKIKKKLSKHTEQSDILENRYNIVSEEIANTKQEIIDCESNLDDASHKLEKLMSKITDAQKKSELKKQKAVLESQLKEKHKQYEEIYKNLTKNIFSNHWVLKGAQPALERYSKKYKDYYKSHQSRIIERKGNAGRLPANVPQPVHIHRMLEDGHCYVCDRPAAQGTPEYESIRKNLETNTSNEDELFVNNFMKYYENLYNQLLSLERIIANIDESIALQFKNLQKVRSDITTIDSKIKDIENGFEGLIEHDGSENIVREFRVHSDNKDQYSGRLASLKQDLNNKEKELKDISKKLDGLVVGKVDDSYREAYRVFEVLNDLSLTTRKWVYENIIKDLEQVSNEVFKNMTSHNSSLKGRIHLRTSTDGRCIPEIIDSTGFALTGMNDANIILVKLSLIIAILTSSHSWSDNYTLISDAPTSKMAYEYSMGFYEELSKQFTQSIIMTYEFTDQNNRREILKNSKIKIGSMFMLEPVFKGGDTNDITQLYIQSSKVSL